MTSTRTALLGSAREILRDPRTALTTSGEALAECLGYLERDPAPLLREDGPTHLTGSCFVFSPDRSQTLLVFHAKGRFWVQPGGHLDDGDESLLAAALRELAEETGTTPDPDTVAFGFDLDHHPLSASFGSCRSHLDIGVAVTVDPAATLTISAESEDLRWWPVNALPENSASSLPRRIDAFRALG